MSGPPKPPSEPARERLTADERIGYQRDYLAWRESVMDEGVIGAPPRDVLIWGNKVYDYRQQEDDSNG